MQGIILATKSDANLIAVISIISCALFLHYFLQTVSCRYTIHVTSLMHLANLVNAVEEFTL